MTCSTCKADVPDTELTCPGCIGKTRRDIAQIVDLSALMLDEATARGVNSEAANLAGPAADPEAWTWRKITARQGRVWHISLIEDDDNHHPLFVLGQWEMMLREDYGPETSERVTISAAADYLDTRLHRIANDPHQDWPLFAQEVRRCRAHLEAVAAVWLHPPKQTGAPCPGCGQADLVKVYVDGDITGKSDRWECGACREWWSDEDYRKRIGAGYLQHADRLTADQIHATYRIPPGTLRRWASEGKVGRRGTDDSGRQLYDVSDALAQREAVLP